MRGKKSLLCSLNSLVFWGWLGWLSCWGVMGPVGRAEALVVVNEVLADPANGLAGDANADGTRSAVHDEFVEILNYGAGEVDISGWSITDASATRHVFPSGTALLPYDFLVVFGGGSPLLTGISWQTASAGALSLNNSAETVRLLDAGFNIVDRLTYDGLANNDQSIVRFPEGEGETFVLHAGLPQAHGALFSPGTSVDGEPLDQATVPEFLTISYFATGVLMMARRKRE